MGGNDRTSAAGAELERARSVQMTMLPPAPTVDTVEIACSYRACDMLGGDFYDFILVDAWRLGIVIADVSGHGTAAALLAAAAKKVLQMCGRGNLSPRKTLLEVNDSIRADIPSGMFLSCLYGVLDIRNHRLCFASCGHNPPVVKRGDRLKDSWNHGNAPVLGVMPSAQLAKFLNEEFIQLSPDDQLLLYTDGLTEAFNNDKAMYGEDRMLECIRAAALEDPKRLIDAIRGDVDRFRGGATLTDDETLVVVRVGTPSERVKPLIEGAVSAESPLPAFNTSLIGRKQDVQTLADALRAGGRRLLSITGPAGAGKTRVAVAAVEAARDAFPGGIHYIDLHHCAAPGEVNRQVATALNLGDDDTRLAVRIGMALKSLGGRGLLVLDNCDRAQGVLKPLVAEWTGAAPSLQLLTTSRAPLGIPQESCHPLRPLAYPKAGSGTFTPADAADTYPSIALFVSRAREADRAFQLTEQNLADVARICARLDGLPQALELAAARVSVLSPRQILERLDKRFELLGADGNTLDGTLAMSWDVLEAPEQKALMMLSQYPNGFLLDTAGALLGRLDGRGAEDLVGSLLKQSLLHFEVMEDLEGDRRFFMYESVRAFANEKLRGTEHAEKVRERYMKAALDYALRWWRADMEKGTPGARRRVLHETETLLDIADTARQPEQRAWASIVVAPILHAQGDQDRAMQLLRGAMAGLLPGSDEWMWIQVVDAELRANEAPEHVAEMLARVHGDPQACFRAALIRAAALQALGRSDEAIGVIHETSKMEGLSAGQQARLKDRLAVIYGAIGRPLDARRLLEAALKQAVEHGDQMLIARITFNLGWASVRGKRPVEAVKQLQEAFEIAVKEGDRGFESSCLGGLALALHVAGKKQESEACALRGIRLSRELGRTFTEVAQLNTLTRIYHEQGREEEALEVALKARKLAGEIGSRKSEALAEGNVAALSLVLGKSFDDAEAAWRRAHDILMELGEVRSALASLSNMGVMMGERWKAKGNPRDLNAAIKHLGEASSRRRDLGYDPLVDAEVMLAELLVETGRKGEARELLAHTLESARQRADDAARKAVSDAERLLDELETQALVARRQRANRAPTGKQQTRQPAPASNERPRMKPPPPRRQSGGSGRAPARGGTSANLPVVKPPPKRSSDSLPVVKAPRPKSSGGELPPVKPRGKKPVSGSLPPVKPRRPKGKPGAAPKRRRPGFN
jgi:predicted ATPase